MLLNFFRGIIIGLITGMPTGPIGALCLKNTITFGVTYGLISGLGSAIADSIYATLASLSFIIVEKFILLHGLYFHIIGGIILISFGIYTFIKEKLNNDVHKSSKTQSLNNNSLLKSFISTFLMAFANPLTIFSFIAVFTGLHLVHIGRELSSRILLIIGVFIGSMIWWFILIFTAGKFNHKLTPKNTKFINKILNSIIISAGVIIFLGAFNTFNVRKPSPLHSKLFQVILNVKYKFVPHKYKFK